MGTDEMLSRDGNASTRPSTICFFFVVFFLIFFSFQHLVNMFWFLFCHGQKKVLSIADVGHRTRSGRMDMRVRSLASFRTLLS